ncbi:MAG: hypothetical protein L0227_07245 [Chloroflexi bacterium]|nr:hypothetical protein [Chloroflexota bacterium]
MTLPFRRRHNDAEASHDRARSIIATGFVEPTDPADDAWLEAHLEGCADCLAELHGYAEDRELLRAMRSSSPEPPRDLWARTAAAIEREGRHDRATRRDPRRRAGRTGPRTLRLPLGVLSGVLVVLVVVATSFFPGDTGLPLGSTPPASDVAVGTPGPEATPLMVTARALSWVEKRSDGTFQLVFADVSEVCVSEPDACAPIDEAGATRLELRAEPESMLLAPDSQQLVVVTKAETDSDDGGQVIIVPVTTPAPSLDPGASASPTTEPSPTVVVTAPPTSAPTPTLGPDETPAPPTLPPPTTRPDGTLRILSDVIVVGEAAYSEDGQWLAFSARPLDGSSGPDLYLWHVGIDGAAVAVTSDHRTFFAGWLGNRILASRVVSAADLPTESPGASGEPGAEPTASPSPTRAPRPTKSPKPGASASPAAGQSGAPDASPDATPGPDEDHPVSFLLDPSTSPATVIDLAGQDIWRPVVNTESRTIVYWSGTLVADATGTGWDLGTGRLVIDGWVDPSAPPLESPDPSASPDTAPTARPGVSTDPLATPVPTPPPGPGGSPVPLAEGPVSDFDVRFDPTGTRLAVWIRDPGNPDLGTLRLFVIDPATGLIDPALDPLPATTALRGFSIGEGRVAWVTPPGQNGEASHVHVLAWTGDEFGQVRSIAADRLFVVR